MRNTSVHGARARHLPPRHRTSERRKHPGAPAIFLSDHMDEIAVEMALKEGGEDFAAASLQVRP